MYKRKVCNKKRKKQKQNKIMLIGTLSLLLFLSIGYAAFQTNLSITAKGNIKDITGAELLRKSCNTPNGNGLYEDEYEKGRCIYKGNNPNNYILIDTEIYRIVAVEQDNRIKIVKNDIVTNTINFDDNTTSRYSVNGYCTDSQGCNTWASNKTLLDTNKNPVSYITINEINYELPEIEAKANRYLNSTGEYNNSGFYNSLSAHTKKQITESYFAIGSVSETDETQISHIIEEENKHYWRGNIGLLNVSDYAKANNTSGNYLSDLYWWYWFINPPVNSRNQLRSRRNGIEGYGIVYYGKGSTVGLIPSFYLSSDIKLSGRGSLENPYVIKN